MGSSLKMLGLVPLVLAIGLTSSKNDNVFSRLYDDLMDDHVYQSAVIPRLSPSQPLDVELGVAPLDFDFVGRVLTANTWIWITWTDFRLSWKPSDYDGLNTTSIPASLLWTPDLEVYNSPSFGGDSFSQQISKHPTEAVVEYRQGYMGPSCNHQGLLLL